MAGWHHWLDGCESEWTLGVGDGQGGLVCCNSWCRKESDMTEWLNWTELKPITIVNTALFVLNFLNLPQGNISTRPEHFEESQDASLPLPIWYQNRLTKQWKSRKLIIQRKGYTCISPDGSYWVSWLPLWKIHPPHPRREPPAFKIERKRRNPREEEVPVQAMAALKFSKKHHIRHHRPHDLPTWDR